ncbi:P-loop containing nucleoside triphosphate hydrolase [Ostreococcus tauri]|uniref:P-loop containing nucleoside triphosphate hydrolase n=2 Tax=Ostreococcus tauri TaxID=70448 RepID=A0A090N3B1_OSTTA|nr:P-loop containing nucleoside triphosphate hydrolase [Ostreococcus tauri]CEF97808.1 P-loop containing nucleoside triphosphate hydrolase [Ostreococcus tauri]|eukprot:XP_003079111.2 P-loop containing nucleoside triphosphate hydrolase [Ostreococcus tauri]
MSAALWVDKHRPHELGDATTVNARTAKHLKLLIARGDCPHLFFHGPSGAGKKTLALAVLREIFGAGVEKVKLENKTWKIDQNDRGVEVELAMMSSNFHCEMNPSDCGSKDRYVVQEVIKEMARSRPIDADGIEGYKVLVLTEVDRLSREAQYGLRRTMEKYSASCRLFLIAERPSKVMDALQSRCLPIRVPGPSIEEIENLLHEVAKKEKLELPPELATRVAQASGRNMRRALLTLETCRVMNYPFKPTQAVQTTDWELYINQIGSEILAEQSPSRLLQVRGRLYELFVNCIPPEIILTNLAKALMKRVDVEVKHQICFWAAHFEVRMQRGGKPIMHLEAFVAQFMALYKSHLVAAFG